MKACFRIIHDLLGSEEWPIARLLLEEMRLLHIQPSVICFNATLTAYANAMRWESAVQLFLLMQKDSLPDRVSLGPQAVVILFLNALCFDIDKNSLKTLLTWTHFHFLFA